MPAGGAVPLGEVAKVTPARGPTSIRTENGQLAVYVYVDIRDRDIGGYVADAQAAVKASIQFPPGAYLMWSGQYEYLERAAARLKIVVPVTLAIIFLLLYLNFRSLTETLIVMLSLPFALVGGLWLMWWLGFNLSVAVVVGFIALAGVAAETGVVMLIYLNQALDERRARKAAEGGALTRNDLYDAIMEGAVERVRPKMMTVVAIMAGLLPIMWSTGTGSEIMQRIAVPMIGGMISSTLLTLIVIPAIYALVKGDAGRSWTRSARCGDRRAIDGDPDELQEPADKMHHRRCLQPLSDLDAATRYVPKPNISDLPFIPGTAVETEEAGRKVKRPGSEKDRPSLGKVGMPRYFCPCLTRPARTGRGRRGIAGSRKRRGMKPR